MAKIYFITHPEVVVDPAIPVPDWDLSEYGRRRMRRLLHQPWAKNLQVVYSSEERKSISAAQLLTDAVRIAHVIVPDLGEVDRSSTGYLPMEEHDRAVAKLFGEPNVSYGGWETARSAQARIVDAVKLIDAEAQLNTSIAIISHGGVGTLLLCHVKGVPISRTEAGPGQGNYFCFRRKVWNLIHGWRPIDEWQEGREVE